MKLPWSDLIWLCFVEYQLLKLKTVGIYKFGAYFHGALFKIITMNVMVFRFTNNSTVYSTKKT